MSTDPVTPVWTLDVAEDVRSYRLRQLEEEMGVQGELATDLSGDLWQLRVRQLDNMLGMNSGNSQ